MVPAFQRRVDVRRLDLLSATTRALHPFAANGSVPSQALSFLNRLELLAETTDMLTAVLPCRSGLTYFELVS